MSELSSGELKEIVLKTDEQISEYNKEIARSKARFDVELYYKNAILLRQKAFIHTFLYCIVGACIGFLISHFTK